MTTLQTVSHQIQAKVDARILECIKLAEAHFGSVFKVPTVSYRIKGLNGGTANHRHYHVDFNPTYLNENTDHYIKQTVGHEVAHIIAHVEYGDHIRAHGQEWKNVMYVLGIPADRCHDYDATNISTRKRNVTKFEYTCGGCGELFLVGNKRHNRMLTGAIYSHSGCRHADRKLKFVRELRNGIAPMPEPTTKWTPKAKTPTPKKTKAPRTGTKAALALVMVRRYSDIDKATVIGMIMSELDMSTAGATTYYYNAKKALAA